jgi:hypothetical protein
MVAPMSSMNVLEERLSPLAYAEARPRIRDGDLLLFRPTSFWGWLIAVGTVNPMAWVRVLMGWQRPRHCHAARAIWWRRSLWAVQQTANPYRHLERLSGVVRRWPGVIDVYQLRPRYEKKYDRIRACEVHKSICLKHYGWYNLLRLVPRHLPLLRRLLPRDGNDQERSKWPPFCSMACSMSDRAGGIDPCPNLADRETEPHDLAESPCYAYRLTLVWEEPETTHKTRKRHRRRSRPVRRTAPPRSRRTGPARPGGRG